MSDRILEKKVKRINKIIDAAEKIFFKHGYENTALKDVAAELDLVKGTIYIYFSSKEELFAAIVLRSQRKLINMLEPYKGNLSKLIDVYADFIKYNKHHFKAILSLPFIQSAAVINSLIDEIEDNNKTITSIFQNSLNNKSYISASILIRAFDSIVFDNAELDSIVKDLKNLIS